MRSQAMKVGIPVELVEQRDHRLHLREERHEDDGDGEQRQPREHGRIGERARRQVAIRKASRRGRPVARTAARSCPPPPCRTRRRHRAWRWRTISRGLTPMSWAAKMPRQNASSVPAIEVDRDVGHDQAANPRPVSPISPSLAATCRLRRLPARRYERMVNARPTVSPGPCFPCRASGSSLDGGGWPENCVTTGAAAMPSGPGPRSIPKDASSG